MWVYLFIIIVRLFVWLLCPLLLAQSVLPKGPFAQASTSSAPKHCDAGSLLSYLRYNVCPSLSSHSFMASSHGVLLFRRSSSILPVGPASFPQFSSPATLQLGANFFLCCQEQCNLQHFLLASWAKFAHRVLLFVPPDIRIYLFLPGNVPGLCSWGSLSPLMRGLRHFLTPVWTYQQVCSLGLVSVLPIFFVAPFP